MTSPPAPSARPEKSAYRPDIDGLRTIAVLSVVVYHAGFSWLSGGFAGVDIFFVISGYLITGLILQEQASNRFSLKTFYIRRARRLFPALFVVLAISTAVAWWLLMPGEMEDFGESLATAAVFSSNFMFWSEAGYFDGPSEFKPLLHTWSLAVEEQYYVLFPLLLLACKKLGRYLTLLVPVALLSLALAQWFITSAPAATFFLLPHRLWELMIGSLLATASLHHPHWFQGWQPALREGVALSGLAALVVTVLCYSGATAFPALSAALPTLGTAALIAAGISGSTYTTRLLATRPFVAVGLISYSLYLWHWPVLVFTKLYFIRPLTVTETLVAVLLAVALGWASWRFVEQPFRTHRKPAAAKTHGPTPSQLTQGLLTDKQVLPFSLGCIALLSVIGVSLDISEGAPDRLPAEIVAIARVADDKPPERKHCSNVEPAEVSMKRLCSLGDKQQPPDFILWGDSHAMVLAPRFAEAAKAQGRSGLNATANGCAALLNTYRPEADPDAECVRFNAAVLELVANNPEIKNVILAGRWAIYAQRTRYKHESGSPLTLVEVSGSNSTATNTNTDNDTNAAVWERSLRHTLETLRELNKNVTIIASVPETGWNTPNVIARSVLLDQPISIAPTLQEFHDRQKQVLPVLAALQERVLHPQAYLCNATLCRVSEDNKPLYIDEDHLSSIGSAQLAPLISDALRH